MAHKRASKNSLFDSFIDFVEENPRLAAMIALQIGILAGEVVAAPSGAIRLMTKRAKKVPQQIADALPRRLSAAGLKYLPGPSPKLQPRKRPAARPHANRKRRPAMNA